MLHEQKLWVEVYEMGSEDGTFGIDGTQTQCASGIILRSETFTKKII